MQTHSDLDQDRYEFLRRLKQRAADQVGLSRITAGAPGERPLAKWAIGELEIRHMPPDEQGILRISIGGGPHTPVAMNYCVIRGDMKECIELIEAVLTELRAIASGSPGEATEGAPA